MSSPPTSPGTAAVDGLSDGIESVPQREIQVEGLAGVPTKYQVFMAAAERIGYDRRGASLYKRGPTARRCWRTRRKTERVRYLGEWVTRTARRKRRIPGNDQPGIAAAYRSFRAEHPEPGIAVVATGSLESWRKNRIDTYDARKSSL